MVPFLAPSHDVSRPRLLGAAFSWLLKATAHY